ncbi:hypothetical protein O0I10_000572 [Lichtheimia ornata]|uniref:Uncharacterized protein n=1 Tax=Lichtheimia ornata TaxID=688661 RepID=A0AAD8DIX2_9FUNG|nr:uncharacterized protein O0I10_000572 [Lichtheimia ornata]KAJ8663333.1 hypothetical protein O0I10_000572 [Lichtheimia ornata]
MSKQQQQRQYNDANFVVEDKNDPHRVFGYREGETQNANYNEADNAYVPADQRQDNIHSDFWSADNQDEERNDPAVFSQNQSDPDRHVAAEVAQSHNMGRSKESRMKSAQRASDTYQEATGNPLEIDKQGRVVEE